MIHYIESLANPSDYGTIGRHQLMVLMGIASMLQNVGTHVLEFGTLSGNTTTNLARMLPNHRVLTCSLPPETRPMLAHGPSELTGYNAAPTFPDDVKSRITHYACDSALLKLPQEAKLGLVFVDGGHTTDYVINDFNLALPLMVKGSVAVFHDYGLDNSTGITEVKAGVDRIMSRHSDWQWVEWNDNGMVWGVKPL